MGTRMLHPSGLCQPMQRGQLPGGLFNPVCSNLNISEQESRAQTAPQPRHHGVKPAPRRVGDVWGHASSPRVPEPKQCSAAPWICTPAARSSRRPRDKAALWGSCSPITRSLAAGRSSQPAAASTKPSLLPLLRLPSLAAQHKGKLPTRSPEGRTLSPCPAPLENSTALETPQPGTDRKGIYSLPCPWVTALNTPALHHSSTLAYLKGNTIARFIVHSQDFAISTHHRDCFVPC